MTVPRKKHPRQPRNIVQRIYTFVFSTAAPANDDAPVPPAPWLDPDEGLAAETDETAPVPRPCPLCGRGAFSLPLSALLDLMTIAKEVLIDAQAIIEDEVL
jgi:hypothetical protein